MNENCRMDILYPVKVSSSRSTRIISIHFGKRIIATCLRMSAGFIFTIRLAMK